MFLNFYAVSNLPLSNYTIISFAKIFFIIPLAFLFLKKKLKLIPFLYIFIGFIGIILCLVIKKVKRTSLLLSLCNYSNYTNSLYKNICEKNF